MRIVTASEELPTGGVLVPTMGGLHEGHLALARLAVAERRRLDLPGVVVSVFVNPRQFEESIDFERYPRDVESDAAMLEPLGVDVVYAPDAREVYEGDAPVDAPLPDVAAGRGLEDRYRPGHLEGVCQVVWRLYELAEPAVAIFGEKDWQQMKIATRLAEAFGRRRGEPLEIIPGPTVREPDGLAMSSRNRFLPELDRQRAPAIFQALSLAGDRGDPAEAEAAMRRHMESRDLRVEYAAVRDAETLLEPRTGEPARALIAARLGEVRLIDNAPWPAGPGEAAVG